MGGLQRAGVIASAVLAASLALSACGGSSSSTASSTSRSTTTSTTLALALPAEQVSQQARGVLSLNDLGTDWSLKPTNVNDFDTLAKSPGYCNGPSLLTRMAGSIGRSWFVYTKPGDTETSLDIFTFVFPSEDAAMAAYAAEVGVYGCANPRESDGSTSSIAVLPDLSVGDESTARSVTTTAGPQYCNAGEPFAITDNVIVRKRATIMRIDLGNFTEGCGNVSAPDAKDLYAIAGKAVYKYESELQAYTEEYYAARATSTKTAKGTTLTTKAK